MHHIFGGESLSCRSDFDASIDAAAPFCGGESSRAPRGPRQRKTPRTGDDGARGPVSAQYRLLLARVLARYRAAEAAGRHYVSLSARDLADHGCREGKAIWLPHATVRSHLARLHAELERRGYTLDRGGLRGGYRLVLQPAIRESQSPQLERCAKTLRVAPRGGVWERKFTRPRLARPTRPDAQSLGDKGGVELRSTSTPNTSTSVRAAGRSPAGDVIAARMFPADWGKAFTSARSVLEAICGACPEIAAARGRSKPVDAKTVRQWRARRTPQPGPWPAPLEVAGLAQVGRMAERRGIGGAKWERWCILAAQIAHVGWRDGIVCAPAGFVIGTLRKWILAGRAARTKNAAPDAARAIAAASSRPVRSTAPPPADALSREAAKSILAELRGRLAHN